MFLKQLFNFIVTLISFTIIVPIFIYIRSPPFYTILVFSLILHPTLPFVPKNPPTTPAKSYSSSKILTLIPPLFHPPPLCPCPNKSSHRPPSPKIVTLHESFSRHLSLFRLGYIKTLNQLRIR